MQNNFNLNILLVDDNQIITEFMSRCLLKLGCELKTAANGKIALEIISNTIQPFDLIIIDMEMPVMNGLEFLKAIKSDVYQIVSKTCGFSSLINVSNYKKYGFDYILDKSAEPNEIEDLLVKVKNNKLSPSS